jgi:hypothetical protein
MSGLPESGHDGAIYEYTPELDAARRSRALAGQAPLHRVRAAGIGAGGDDAEVGARLLERLRIDVGLFGRLLGIADLLRAISERVRDRGRDDATIAAGVGRYACRFDSEQRAVR